MHSINEDTINLLKNTRKKVFKAPYPLSNKLLELIENAPPSHFHLVNPSGLYPYIYLTNYIIEVSRILFNKDIETLKFLDWGCGKGHMTFLLTEKNANVTCCDIEKCQNDSYFGQETPIIDKCNINVVPLKDDVILPFENQEFDVVISCGVLEHVKSDSDSLKEIYRILKPQGLFFCLYLPYSFSWTQRLSIPLGVCCHDRLYTKKMVAELLSKNNFDLLISQRQFVQKIATGQ